MKKGSQTPAVPRWLAKVLSNPRAPMYSFRCYQVPKSQRPVCGAKTRKGQPCQMRVVWDEESNQPRNGRCRLHGGPTTGPRRPEGRKRIPHASRKRMLQRWEDIKTQMERLRQRPTEGA